MAPRAGKREDIMTANISRDLERLFDPYNFDHMPKEDRLDLFKQRDLPHIKHYKAAVKIFGGPPRRTRAIVAPPMETPLKHRLGLYFNREEPHPSKKLNGPLRPQPEPIKELTEEEKARNSEVEKTANYKSWVGERQKLRSNLNGLALNEAMLARKTDKTELETRVQAKFKANRTWKPETPPPKEETPPPKPVPDIPTMNVPPPDGLQILDKFLSLNRMRLIDLFKITDKDKSWSLSREEFLNAISQSAMPISEGEVDDMFIALDANLDEELNFSELNKGLMQWRRQRRVIKKNSIDEASHKTSAHESLSSRLAPASGSTVKHGSVEERAMSMRSSRASSPKKSRESQEKSSSQERTASKKSSRDTQEMTSSQDRTTSKKSSRETSEQHPSRGGLTREDSNLSKSSLKSSQIKMSATSAEKGSESQMGTMTGSIYDTMPKSREKSNVSSTKVPASEFSTSKSALDTPRDILYDPPRPPSQTRVKIMDVPASSESSLLDTTQTDGQTDKSLFEDLLFQSDDTPKVTDVSKDNDDNDDDGTDSKAYTEKSIRTGSRKIGSATSDTRSRTSTPNSLEPPEFDTTRTESRAPESAEAMLDIRKHDRVVLSRNTIKRTLSRDKRVTFDELPGVIRIGYKPIDDHCADSTLKGENAGMVEQFRREKLKEYFEVRKLFEERGIAMTQKTLDRVLLYPGDRTVHTLKKDIALPLGPITNELSPFNQPKPKKKPTKRRRAFATRMAKSMAQGGGSQGPGHGNGASEDDGSGSASSKRSFITVEDVYPFASTVTPKVYKENLSSGRALISRKVDNWMTFEEYTKYTDHLPRRFQHFNRPSNPDTIWPGYVLDKMRLCMPPYREGVDGKGRPIKNRDFVDYEGLGTGLYNGMGSAVFQSTAQKKMAYHGYNNDLNTWPVGPNGVMYGNIDEHRIVK